MRRILTESLVRPASLAIALAFGIAIAPAIGAPVSARWVAVLAFAVLAVRRREYAIVCALALGMARGDEPPEPVPAHVDDRVLDTITGDVGGPVVRGAHGFGAAIDDVWVWSEIALLPGERVAVTGYLVTPRGARGPALPDRARALATRGARFELTAIRVERLADTPGITARVWRWAAATQADGVAMIDATGGDPIGSAALRGIALGDRTTIPAELDARWRAVGIYHVLSVSGLHLAVIALLCFHWLRRLIAASPWGGRIRPARWAGPPALAIALAYTLITGGQIATLRALLVVAIVITGAMLDRPVRFVDALAAAAIALLAWRPADLFDPGFQLSFAAALTLALRGDPDGPRTLVRRWIVRPAITSIWITIVTAPITAHHFQEIAVGGVVGNVVFTPVLELLALPLALGGLAIGWEAPVWLASWIVGLVDRCAEPLAQVLPIGKVAVASPVTMAVLAAIALALAARRQRDRRDAALWIALCAGWLLARTPPPEGALRVTFVDVGQGDAAIVELPDGDVWLIDAGGIANARDVTAGSAPGRAISRVLAAFGHDRIGIAMISHPHPDHYLGLYGLDVPIDELWFVPDDELGELDRIVAAFASAGTRVVHPPLGVARVQAGVELIAWAPRFEAYEGAPIRLAEDPVRSVNDNSLVVALRYRGRTILFTGDLEHEGEEALVAAGLGRADVVKVAHHGSRTSSTRALVEATRPALAVISCGRANQFRFPAASVIERWRAVGAAIARTDTEGTITVTIDDEGGLKVDRFVP